MIKHGLLPGLLDRRDRRVRPDLLSTRMLMVTTLGEDYLTFAEAKGLRRGGS